MLSRFNTCGKNVAIVYAEIIVQTGIFFFDRRNATNAIRNNTINPLAELI